jgi:NAD+ kinase
VLEGTDVVAESFGPAANEVVVEHLETQIAFRVEVGGTNFYGPEELTARSVLVATATGSTAQNVSHGGPIIVPPSRHVALTPISPYRLSTRPLVLDELENGGSIDIRPLQFKDSVGVQLLIDGRKVTSSRGVIEAGATFRVRAAATPFLLVTFGPAAFARALREKKGFAL